MATNKSGTRKTTTRNIICRNVSKKVADQLDIYKEIHHIKTDSGATKSMIKNINSLLEENKQLKKDVEEITAIFNGQRKILNGISTSLKFLEFQA